MKKLIIPMLLLALVACKKEEEKAAETNGPVSVTKENLVATWSINKFEAFAIPGDSLMSTYNFAPGTASFTLRNDNTYSTVAPLGTSNGTYVLTKLNGKDFIILNEPGDEPDTNEVKELTKSTLIMDNKYAETNAGSDDYSKSYMTK